MEEDKTSFEITQEHLNEINNINKDLKFLDNYDIEELRKKAFNKMFDIKFKCYANDNIKQLKRDFSISKAIDETEKLIINKLGSIENFKGLHEFNNLKYYFYFSGENEIKGNTIKFKVYGSPCFSYFIPPFYSFMEYLKGNKQEDYKFIHDEIEKKGKEESYKKDGFFSVGDYSFNLFKNGRLDVSFKDSNGIKLFIENYKKFEELRKAFNDYN